MTSAQSSLPAEVLIAICEHTRSDPTSRSFDSRLAIITPYALHLDSFSCASRQFRHVSAPMLFQRVCMRTREQVAALVQGPLLSHVRHVHFPTLNILMSRRPLGAHIHALLRQARSLVLASSEPGFYVDIPRHLAPLLPLCHHLERIELYYGARAKIPHMDPTAALAEFVGTGMTRSTKTLSVKLPGERPSFAGIESLFTRLDALSALQHLFLSMQLPFQLALSPSDLALSLAQRLPRLSLVVITTSRRDDTGTWGMSGSELKVWEVRRSSERVDIYEIKAEE